MRFYALLHIILAGLVVLSTASNSQGSEVTAESRRLELTELISRDSTQSSGLPPSVAAAFAHVIPERLLLRNDAGFLSGPDPDFRFVLGFHAANRIPWNGESKRAQWCCYLGGNRGFCAIIEERKGGAEVVWSADKLGSFVSPSIEFVELTGSAPPEIVVRGYPGLGSDQGGHVVLWDGVRGQRLTEHTRGFQASYWEYVDLDSIGTKGILLHDNDRKGARWEQLLRYDPDSNAIVAGPKKVVGDERE